MNVLLTGASGFLGRYVLEQLKADGDNVFALSSKAQPEEQGVTWLQADFLHDDLTPIIEQVKPNRVVHMAWECGRYDETVHMDWVAASLRWMDALRDHGCEHLLTIGSSMEYQWSEQPCHETDTPLQPSTMYGHAKLALGQLVSAYCQRSNIKHCHARAFFICGVGEGERRLIPAAIRALQNGEPFTCNSGHAYRDYLDAQDVASSIAMLSQKQTDDTVNVAAGKAVQLRELMDAVGRAFDRPDLLSYGEPKEGAPRDIALADVHKLQEALGFVPAFDPNDTIKRMVSAMAGPTNAGVHE